jgi:hypothetical protein
MSLLLFNHVKGVFWSIFNFVSDSVERFFRLIKLNDLLKLILF